MRKPLLVGETVQRVKKLGRHKVCASWYATTFLT